MFVTNRYILMVSEQHGPFLGGTIWPPQRDHWKCNKYFFFFFFFYKILSLFWSDRHSTRCPVWQYTPHYFRVSVFWISKYNGSLWMNPDNVDLHIYQVSLWWSWSSTAPPTSFWFLQQLQTRRPPLSDARSHHFWISESKWSGRQRRFI